MGFQVGRDNKQKRPHTLLGSVDGAESQEANIPLCDATAPEVARWTKCVGVPTPSRFLLAGMDGATLENLSNEELASQLQLDPSAAEKLSRELATAKNSGLAFQGCQFNNHAHALDLFEMEMEFYFQSKQ